MVRYRLESGDMTQRHKQLIRGVRIDRAVRFQVGNRLAGGFVRDCLGRFTTRSEPEEEGFRPVPWLQMIAATEPGLPASHSTCGMCDSIPSCFRRWVNRRACRLPTDSSRPAMAGKPPAVVSAGRVNSVSPFTPEQGWIRAVISPPPRG